jgi:sugar phosphate isomerase/epimerase
MEQVRLLPLRERGFFNPKSIMTTRREYLRLSALAAVAGCSLRLPATDVRRELLYGVQIAGIRHEAEQDLPQLLHALRQIGFTEVELHTIVYNHPAATLRHMLEDAGLRSPAGHFSLSAIEPQINYARELGLEYMVAMLRPNPQTLDEYKQIAGQLNQTGSFVHDHGMKFALLFHNHELKPQDGSSGFAELMKHTDPALVSLEVDIYWIVQAGLAPSDFLRQHKDRVKLLHLKDRLPGFPTTYTTDPDSDHSTELGKGSINWGTLLKQARKQGIRYAFLDYDKTSIPILDSLKQSFTYLETLKDE